LAPADGLSMVWVAVITQSPWVIRAISAHDYCGDHVFSSNLNSPPLAIAA
jgi:hypothetical protein